MAKDKEREPDVSDEGMTISFRLYEPHAGMLRRLNESNRGKSLHETARALLVISLDQQPMRDSLAQLERARGDIDELRKSLARSVEAILLNLRTDLPEKDIKEWVFEKLWPQAK